MKSWNVLKTALAERLADGRRFASGKTIEVVDLPNFLEAVDPGSRGTEQLVASVIESVSDPGAGSYARVTILRLQ